MEDRLRYSGTVFDVLRRGVREPSAERLHLGFDSRMLHPGASRVARVVLVDEAGFCGSADSAARINLTWALRTVLATEALSARQLGRVLECAVRFFGDSSNRVRQNASWAVESAASYARIPAESAESAVGAMVAAMHDEEPTVVQNSAWGIVEAAMVPGAVSRVALSGLNAARAFTDSQQQGVAGNSAWIIARAAWKGGVSPQDREDTHDQLVYLLGCLRTLPWRRTGAAVALGHELAHRHPDARHREQELVQSLIRSLQQVKWTAFRDDAASFGAPLALAAALAHGAVPSHLLQDAAAAILAATPAPDDSGSQVLRAAVAAARLALAVAREKEKEGREGRKEGEEGGGEREGGEEAVKEEEGGGMVGGKEGDEGEKARVEARGSGEGEGEGEEKDKQPPGPPHHLSPPTPISPRPLPPPLQLDPSEEVWGYKEKAWSAEDPSSWTLRECDLLDVFAGLREIRLLDVSGLFPRVLRQVLPRFGSVTLRRLLPDLIATLGWVVRRNPNDHDFISAARDIVRVVELKIVRDGGGISPFPPSTHGSPPLKPLPLPGPPSPPSSFPSPTLAAIGTFLRGRAADTRTTVLEFLFGARHTNEFVEKCMGLGWFSLGTSTIRGQEAYVLSSMLNLRTTRSAQVRPALVLRTRALADRSIELLRWRSTQVAPEGTISSLQTDLRTAQHQRVTEELGRILVATSLVWVSPRAIDSSLVAALKGLCAAIRHNAVPYQAWPKLARSVAAVIDHKNPAVRCHANDAFSGASREAHAPLDAVQHAFRAALSSLALGESADQAVSARVLGAAVATHNRVSNSTIAAAVDSLLTILPKPAAPLSQIMTIELDPIPNTSDPTSPPPSTPYPRNMLSPAAAASFRWESPSVGAVFRSEPLPPIEDSDIVLPDDITPLAAAHALAELLLHSPAECVDEWGEKVMVALATYSMRLDDSRLLGEVSWLLGRAVAFGHLSSHASLRGVGLLAHLMLAHPLDGHAVALSTSLSATARVSKHQCSRVAAAAALLASPHPEARHLSCSGLSLARDGLAIGWACLSRARALQPRLTLWKAAQVAETTLLPPCLPDDPAQRHALHCIQKWCRVAQGHTEDGEDGGGGGEEGGVGESKAGEDDGEDDDDVGDEDGDEDGDEGERRRRGEGGGEGWVVRGREEGKSERLDVLLALGVGSTDGGALTASGMAIVSTLMQQAWAGNEGVLPVFAALSSFQPSVWAPVALGGLQGAVSARRLPLTCGHSLVSLAQSMLDTAEGPTAAKSLIQLIAGPRTHPDIAAAAGRALVDIPESVLVEAEVGKRLLAARGAHEHVAVDTLVSIAKRLLERADSLQVVGEGLDDHTIEDMIHPDDAGGRSGGEEGEGDEGGEERERRRPLGDETLTRLLVEHMTNGGAGGRIARTAAAGGGGGGRGGGEGGGDRGEGEEAERDMQRKRELWRQVRRAITFLGSALRVGGTRHASSRHAAELLCKLSERTASRLRRVCALEQIRIALMEPRVTHLLRAEMAKQLHKLACDDDDDDIAVKTETVAALKELVTASPDKESFVQLAVSGILAAFSREDEAQRNAIMPHIARVASATCSKDLVRCIAQAQTRPGTAVASAEAVTTLCARGDLSALQHQTLLVVTFQEFVHCAVCMILDESRYHSSGGGAGGGSAAASSSTSLSSSLTSKDSPMSPISSSSRRRWQRKTDTTPPSSSSTTTTTHAARDPSTSLTEAAEKAAGVALLTESVQVLARAAPKSHRDEPSRSPRDELPPFSISDELAEQLCALSRSAISKRESLAALIATVVRVTRSRHSELISALMFLLERNVQPSPRIARGLGAALTDAHSSDRIDEWIAQSASHPERRKLLREALGLALTEAREVDAVRLLRLFATPSSSPPTTP